MQSKAKKLIEMIQTAPVEWKPLGEVAEYSKNRICSDKLNEHNYVGVDNLLQNREGKKLSGYVPSEGKMTEYIVNDILIGNIRPYLKKIWQADCTGGTNGDVLVIRVTDEKVNPKYLYQVLADDKFFAFNMKHAKGAKMPRGSKTAIMQYKIPIPPLETQQKIVKILDKFTELEAMLETALEAELALRKRQYQYYRDFLLDFDNQIGGGIADGYKGRLKDVVWKTLGEISDIKVGKSPETNEIGNYPFINAGTIPSGYIASYNTEPDTITTPSRGQGGIGYVGYQASKFWCGPLCYRVRSNNNLIMTKFLYYVMSKDMSKIINLANMAGIPALNEKDLVNFLIPIPPLAEEEKIVAILDKFDTLTHSISEGLPHEIALRRKQYEYYREQLLAFPTAA